MLRQNADIDNLNGNKSVKLYKKFKLIFKTNSELINQKYVQIKIYIKYLLYLILRLPFEYTKIC